jgi:UMF1 family MFS transporter
MTTVWQFYLLAALVGSVQGGSQALSRSLFARLIPRTRSAEFFSFFSICEKLSGVFGPALFAAVTAATGSSRNAILSVIALFAGGGLLLLAVDVPRGQQAARDAESDASIELGVRQ